MSNQYKQYEEVHLNKGEEASIMKLVKFHGEKKSLVGDKCTNSNWKQENKCAYKFNLLCHIGNKCYDSINE
jgi:hypothetical protein